MTCKVCKIKESHQYSSMCKNCIDIGWRKCIDGYYKEKPRKIYKGAVIDSSRIKVIKK